MKLQYKKVLVEVNQKNSTSCPEAFWIHHRNGARSAQSEAAESLAEVEKQLFELEESRQ